MLAPYKITETELDKIQNLSLTPAEATKLDGNLTYLTGWLDVKKRFAIRELGRQDVDLGDAPDDDDLNEIIPKEFFENYRLCFRALQSQARDILDATRNPIALAAFHKVHRHHAPKPARRELALHNKISALAKLAQVTEDGPQALKWCRDSLEKAAGRQCQYCFELYLKVPEAKRWRGSRIENFEIYHDFWNEEDPANYEFRLKAVRNFEQGMAVLVEKAVQKRPICNV